jgi:hypothetical protein
MTMMIVLMKDTPHQTEGDDEDTVETGGNHQNPEQSVHRDVGNEVAELQNLHMS